VVRFCTADRALIGLPYPWTAARTQILRSNLRNIELLPQNCYWFPANGFARDPRALNRQIEP